MVATCPRVCCDVSRSCTYLHICIQLCVSPRVQVYLCVSMCVRMCVYTCVCTSTYLGHTCVYMFVSKCVFPCTDMSLGLRVPVCLCTCVCVPTCVCTYMCALQVVCPRACVHLCICAPVSTVRPCVPPPHRPMSARTCGYTRVSHIRDCATGMWLCPCVSRVCDSARPRVSALVSAARAHSNTSTVVSGQGRVQSEVTSISR